MQNNACKQCACILPQPTVPAAYAWRSHCAQRLYEAAWAWGGCSCKDRDSGLVSGASTSFLNNLRMSCFNQAWIYGFLSTILAWISCVLLSKLQTLSCRPAWRVQEYVAEWWSAGAVSTVRFSVNILCDAHLITPNHALVRANMPWRQCTVSKWQAGRAATEAACLQWQKCCSYSCCHAFCCQMPCRANNWTSLSCRVCAPPLVVRSLYFSIILLCVRATPSGEITVFFHYPVLCARHPKWWDHCIFPLSCLVRAPPQVVRSLYFSISCLVRAPPQVVRSLYFSIFLSCARATPSGEITVLSSFTDSCSRCKFW